MTILHPHQLHCFYWKQLNFNTRETHTVLAAYHYQLYKILSATFDPYLVNNPDHHFLFGILVIALPVSYDLWKHFVLLSTFFILFRILLLFTVLACKNHYLVSFFGFCFYLFFFYLLSSFFLFKANFFIQLSIFFNFVNFNFL